MSEKSVELPGLEKFKPVTDVERIAAGAGSAAGFAGGIVLLTHTEWTEQATERVTERTPAQDPQFIGPQLDHKIEVPVGKPVEHPGTLMKMGEVFGPAALVAFTVGAIACSIRYRLHGRRQAKHRRVYAEEIDATVAREFKTGIETLNNWVHRQEKKKDN